VGITTLTIIEGGLHPSVGLTAVGRQVFPADTLLVTHWTRE